MDLRLMMIGFTDTNHMVTISHSSWSNFLKLT